MNSRIPKTFAPTVERKPLFRLGPGNAVQLNIPAYALEPGQVGTFAGNGGAKLALGASGTDDAFLQVNDDGSASIRLS